MIKNIKLIMITSILFVACSVKQEKVTILDEAKVISPSIVTIKKFTPIEQKTEVFVDTLEPSTLSPMETKIETVIEKIEEKVDLKTEYAIDENTPLILKNQSAERAYE